MLESPIAGAYSITFTCNAANGECVLTDNNAGKDIRLHRDDAFDQFIPRGAVSASIWGVYVYNAWGRLVRMNDDDPMTTIDE